MSHYKPYPAYKDSGVEWLGKVPEHWSIVPLKWCFECLDGKRVPLNSEQRADIKGEVPYWGSGGVVDHIEKFIFDEPLVLLGEDGAPFFDRDRPVAYAIQGKSWINNHIHVLRPLTDYPITWFVHALNCVEYRHYIDGSTRDKLTQDDMKSISLVIPESPDEARRAVAHLARETARIDALIEKKARFIELLREKRQALITHAVTKGLDSSVKMKDSGVEWLGEVPEHWDVLPLRHTARLESGHTPSRSKPEYWVDCTVPWFTLADVWQVRSGEQKYVSETSEKVSQLGLENSSARLLPAGSVFLSRTASVGFPGIMEVDMATSQDFAVWTCSDELFNEYLYYVLLGMKPDFDRLMMGSTHKTIYMPDIEAIRIARSPVDEQRGIVSALSGQLGRFKTVIDKTERSIELLKERRAALITAAVTGQIDLREAV